MARKMAAFGQAEGIWMRMRASPSTTRAAILMRCRRKVANSALARAERLGGGLAYGEHEPVGGGVENEAELVGLRLAA